MPEEIVDLGDVRLCVETVGAPDDPTILMISGAAESMDGWDPVWCGQLAAAGRRVVRYDHRDTGRSTASPAGHPSYPGSALSGDVLRILDALDVDRAHLVGLSMGGGIAQEVAARHPDRVATLTLIATSPAGRRQDDAPLPPPETRVAETFDDPLPEPDWTDRQAVVDYLVESYRPYAGSLGFDEPATRRLVEHVVDRTVDIEAASKNHWLVAGDEEQGFAMSDIVAPTLVIHGTDRPDVPARARRGPRARDPRGHAAPGAGAWATSGPRRRPRRGHRGDRAAHAARGHWTTTTAPRTSTPTQQLPRLTATPRRQPPRGPR